MIPENRQLGDCVPDKRAFSNDSVDANEFVHKRSVQAFGCYVVSPEISLEANRESCLQAKNQGTNQQSN